MKNNTNQIETHRAKLIGSLFLLAFVAYGLGRHFFESENATEKNIGAMLIISNSVIVLFIGIFLRILIHRYDSLAGNIYLFTRIIEALALASIVLNLIPPIQINNDFGYIIAMLILGLGSIPMCLTLYRCNITPAWLALWGIIGYAVFAFGFLMELFGKQWSMYLLALGGLWEITFGIWLIIKGNKKTVK